MPKYARPLVKSDIPGTMKNPNGTYKPDYGYAIGKGISKTVMDGANALTSKTFKNNMQTGMRNIGNSLLKRKKKMAEPGMMYKKKMKMKKKRKAKGVVQGFRNSDNYPQNKGHNKAKKHKSMPVKCKKHGMVHHCK